MEAMRKLLPKWRTSRSLRRENGQSMVETAIMVPILVGIAFNAINVGYFWFMVLTMTAIPRLGAECSTQGGKAISVSSGPTTTEVSTFVYENLTGAIKATSSNASVEVCSQKAGVNSTTHAALCDTFGPSYSYTSVTVDPEAPNF